ncbi:unnamed protein product [Alopecurus aequalis]
MLSSLPDDLISEILSRVPVQAACRLRCVSRQWRALISSRAFLAAHKSRADPLLLSVTAVPSFIHDRSSSSVLQLMDMDGNVIRVIEKPTLWTMNYCYDSPVCVCVDEDRYVCVVDYATGNVVRTSAELNHEYLYDISVGCAVPSHTYKLVRVMSKDDPNNMVLTLLEDGAKWRRVQSPPTPSLSRCSSVTVTGVMHFLQEDDENYVHRFDLESEEWKDPIKGPTTSSGEELREYKRMGKLDDALYMAQWSSTNVCLIWILTDSAKSTWVKMYAIPMPPNFDSLVPLTVMHDSRKLLFCARDRSTTTLTLQVYDPLTATCTHLTKSFFDEELAKNLLGNAGICVLHLEYFVSPKMIPISVPAMFSRLISFRWLRRLNPLSHFYN